LDSQNLPAGQSRHVVALPSEYWPRAHSAGASSVLWHCDPAGQSAQFVAKATEKVPASHATGDLDADSQEKPAGHGSQESDALRA